MKRFLTMSCVLASVWVFGGVTLPAARANMITLTQDFGSAHSPIGVPSLTPPSVTFNQFDPTLGTLTEVDIAIELNAHVSASVQNNTPNQATIGTLTGSVGLDLLDSSSNDLLSMSASQELLSTPIYVQGSGNLSPSFGPQFTSALSSAAFMSGPGFQDFYGPGTVSLSVPNSAGASDTVTSAQGPGTIIPLPGGDNMYGSVTVTYDYQAPGAVVPEPTSLTLLVLGALGIAGYTWRRRLH